MSAIPVSRHAGGGGSLLQRNLRGFTGRAGMTLLAISLVSVFLMPLGYMVATAFKERTQLTAPDAPLYPAEPDTFAWEGSEYPVYDVPTPDGQVHAWALVQPGRESSVFVDPSNPEAGPIEWEGRKFTFVFVGLRKVRSP